VGLPGKVIVGDDSIPASIELSGGFQARLMRRKPSSQRFHANYTRAGPVKALEASTSSYGLQRHCVWLGDERQVPEYIDRHARCCPGHPPKTRKALYTSRKRGESRGNSPKPSIPAHVLSNTFRQETTISTGTELLARGAYPALASLKERLQVPGTQKEQL
jgi:hypothetical protein